MPIVKKNYRGFGIKILILKLIFYLLELQKRLDGVGENEHAS
jgi:hypothetical protein